jgi:DNA polymerase
MKDKQKLLDEVAVKINKELNCPLKDAANNLVFGKGNPNAEILFIGEAPGAKEDEAGIPFVGKAGKDLDKELNKIGLTLEDVYIANILKYRPPKNRDPTPIEIENHTPYLVKQIEIIKPKYVCTLGNFSTKYVLANGDVKLMKKIEGVDSLHGIPKEIEFRGEMITVFPLHHPSSIIYSKDRRKWFSEDFEKLERLLFGKNRTKEIQKSLVCL